MRLKIDPGAAGQLTYLGESIEAGDRRRTYRAPEPYRVLLVCRNGLALETLVGEVVDAFISEERGDLPFAPATDARQRHTRISLFGRLPHTLAERTLTQMLAAGQKSQPGVPADAATPKL